MLGNNTEAPMQRLHSVRMSISGQCRWLKNNSMSPMVITKVRQPHCSDIKRSPEILGDIQAIIDNDPSKSIRPIARGMAVPEFLIRQLVPEYIMYFSYKLRKGQFLSQTRNDKIEKPHRKAFQQSQASPPSEQTLCFFSREKYLTGPNRERRKSHWLALSPQNVPIVIRIKHPVHIMVFGVVTGDGDVILLFILPHGPTRKIEVYIKCLELILLLWIERVAGNRILAIPRK